MIRDERSPEYVRAFFEFHNQMCQDFVHGLGEDAKSVM